jgi:hypothetical protein
MRTIPSKDLHVSKVTYCVLTRTAVVEGNFKTNIIKDIDMHEVEIYLLTFKL